jgi:hypothetical protein
MRNTYDDDDQYRRYDDADDDFERNRRPRRRRRQHSMLGVASFIVAIAAGAMIFFTLVGTAILEARQGELRDDDSRTTTVGCLVIAGGGLGFIGVILGLIGVLDNRRKRLFAGLGLGFSACIVLGVITLCVIGMLI